MYMALGSTPEVTQETGSWKTVLMGMGMLFLITLFSQGYKRR